MSSMFEFDAEFAAFVGEAGWVPQDDDGISVLANQNGRGEIRYHVHTDQDGHLTVTRTERAQDPEVVAITTEADIVHRYLATVIGEAHRELDSFLLLWNVDPEAVTPKDGYRLQPLGGTLWFALIGPDNNVVPVQLHRFDAITYSFVAEISLPDLYASFLDPEGYPALHDAWLRWQERRSAA